jgi:hypothetical protein
MNPPARWIQAEPIADETDLDLAADRLAVLAYPWPLILRGSRRHLGARFMDEAPVRSAPHILNSGNDRAAPRTDLTRGSQFILFRVKR